MSCVTSFGYNRTQTDLTNIRKPIPSRVGLNAFMVELRRRLELDRLEVLGSPNFEEVLDFLLAFL